MKRLIAYLAVITTALCLARGALAQTTQPGSPGNTVKIVKDASFGLGLDYYNTDSFMLKASSRFILAGGVGTDGVSVTLGTNLGSRLQGRFVLSAAAFGYTTRWGVEIAQPWLITQRVDTRFSYASYELSFLLDYNLTARRNLWITAGVMVGNGKGKFYATTVNPLPIPQEAVGTTGYAYDGHLITTRPDGRAYGEIWVNPVKPYVGIAWRPWLRRDMKNAKWPYGSFLTVELGAAYWGKPETVAWDHSGPTPVRLSGFGSNDIGNTDSGRIDFMRSLPVMPILRITIGLEQIM